MTRRFLIALAFLAAVLVPAPCLADTQNIFNNVGPNGELVSLIYNGQSGYFYSWTLIIDTRTAPSLYNSYFDSISVQLLAAAGVTRRPAWTPDKSSIDIAGFTGESRFKPGEAGNTSSTDTGTGITCVGGSNGAAMCAEFLNNPKTLAVGPTGTVIVVNFTFFVSSAIRTDSVWVQYGFSNGKTGDAQLRIGDVAKGPVHVPEPASMVLFGSGLLAAAGAIRRRFLS